MSSPDPLLTKKNYRAVVEYYESRAQRAQTASDRERLAAHAEHYRTKLKAQEGEAAIPRKPFAPRA
jgi:hypothetical protein